MESRIVVDFAVSLINNLILATFLDVKTNSIPIPIKLYIYSCSLLDSPCFIRIEV